MRARQAETARVSVEVQTKTAVVAVEARKAEGGDEADVQAGGHASEGGRKRLVVGIQRRPGLPGDAEELEGGKGCRSWPWNRAAGLEEAVSDWEQGEEAGRGAGSTGVGRADV